MRPTMLALTAVALVGLGAPAGAGASGGADGRSCGRLDDTRGVQLEAYSVSCGKASDVVKRAVGAAVTSSKVRTVHGTYLGFSCRGAASERRISISCRRGGGAQFLTAKGAV